MILADTGFLVAVLVRTDNLHQRSLELLKQQTEPLVTTWCCVTEAMYLTKVFGGRTAQIRLCDQLSAGLFSLLELTNNDAYRVCRLMHQYADAPMDFADGSLVVAAEKLGVTRILTFDRHFYAYMINSKTPFDVLG